MQAEIVEVGRIVAAKREVRSANRLQHNARNRLAGGVQHFQLRIERRLIAGRVDLEDQLLALLRVEAVQIDIGVCAFGRGANDAARHRVDGDWICGRSRIVRFLLRDFGL